MKQISLDCTERMAAFAGRIIRESVDILKPGKPPCDFVAVAIGSLARGEATPYSDLEFFFLIEHKTPAITKYFENLAITIYFQIGNFGETKLNYMAVKELQGWFDDQAKNGFKIDGLTNQAGNIPTGNGSPHQRNHFIVTQDELVSRYRETLNEPDKEKALRGDLTAMLTYMKPIYAYQSENKNLLNELQTLIQNSPINSLRREVNLEMLQTDARKFNFRPSFELLHNGLNTDVKREIYRFPSILLLDINIVVQMYADSSWQSLELLQEQKHISAQLQFVLRLLLSSAAYMRLSAYLHHGSQDERMSVGHEIASSTQRTQSNYCSSQSTRRWFVPSGLYTQMCTKMISLKRKIANSSEIMLDLETLTLNDDDLWTNITTVFYTGRFRETLALLKQVLGVDFVEDPLSVTQIISPDEDVLEIVNIISSTLFMCYEPKAELMFNEHIMTKLLIDRRIRIANCFRLLGNPRKAVDILESVTEESPYKYFHLGQAYLGTKEHDKAERSFIKVLEHDSATSSSEPLYDYYGDSIMTDELTDMSKGGLVSDLTPEERLSSITVVSHGVIISLIGLGSVYGAEGQHNLSISYLKKALLLMSELHGSEAAVPYAAEIVRYLGDAFYQMGQHSEAVDHYKQALTVIKRLPKDSLNSVFAHAITRVGNSLVLSGRDGEARDHYKATLPLFKEFLEESTESNEGKIRIDLSTILVTLGQDEEAQKHLKHALDIERRLSQGATNNYIRHALRLLGITYKKLRQFCEAADWSRRTLVNFRRSSQDDPSTSSDVAEYLKYIGDIYYKMGQNTKAEYYYEQALILFRILSQGSTSNEIAETLFKLGRNYIGVSHSKAIGALREAVHTYIRVDDEQPVNPNIMEIWDMLSIQLNHHHRI